MDGFQCADVPGAFHGDGDNRLSRGFTGIGEIMLERLLQLIREGGSFDVTRLARELETTPEMVRAMMDHLRRTGLLKTYDPGQSSCEYCALGSVCDQEKKKQEAGHLWMYEEK